MNDAVVAAVAEAHRRDWARVLAATAQLTRDLDLAEECTQEAYAQALPDLAARPASRTGRARGSPRRPQPGPGRAAPRVGAAPGAAAAGAGRPVPGPDDGSRRRPAAADLHLLPPGARAARPRSR